MNGIMRGLVALVAVLFVATGMAQAQAMPAGRQLLTQMRAAMQAKGSYHMQGSVVVRVASQPTQRLTMRGDIATNPREAHITVTSQTAGGPITIEEILVGSRMALRTGNNPWQCRSVTSVQQLTGSLVGSPQMTSARTLGTGTFNGTPVWRVRTAVVIQVLGRTERVHLTYFIAQSDHTLLLEKARPVLRLNNAAAHERLRFTFSRHGERVNATLPAACAA